MFLGANRTYRTHWRRCLGAVTLPDRTVGFVFPLSDGFGRAGLLFSLSTGSRLATIPFCSVGIAICHKLNSIISCYPLSH